MNLAKFKKSEIIWLNDHHCKHHHTYLEHYNCFLAERPDQKRTGLIDIEATNLKADFGIVLCYCIKELGVDKIHEAVITKRDLSMKGYLDKRVMRKCIEDMKRFDLLVGYYSTGFDIPFLRTRALAHKLSFPPFGSIHHKDIYYIIRNRFQLSSSRLENASRVLLGHSDKTRIDSEKWILALQGNTHALKYIIEHCRNDVRDLEKLYVATIEYTGVSTPSI